MSPRPARASKRPSPSSRNERADAPAPARKKRKSDTAHAGAAATGARRAPSKDDLAPGCPFSLLERRAGVLLHPTSLPGPHGSGDIGPAAHEFIDRLADAGQGWWQMLPIGPAGSGASPYSSPSSFAGNPLLISLERLAEDGLLDAADISPTDDLLDAEVHWDAVRRFRRERLERAFARFYADLDEAAHAEFDRFCAQNDAWLGDYVLYTALHEENELRAWTTWPAGERRRDGKAIERATERLHDAMHLHAFCQWQLDRQWRALHEHATARGVGLLGDVPIFVAHDSADVWANDELFLLNRDGTPKEVAGVPPDAFSDGGQLWGNPLYRWDVLGATGYAWWIARVRKTLERFDAVRLDHFIGFHRAWHVPAGAKDARDGRFVLGPEDELFDAIRDALGEVPFIAEDLGLVTEEVHALRERQGFPCMRLLHWAFGDDGRGNEHTPHNLERNTVLYTGTHDSDTTVGWYRGPREAGDRRTDAEIERPRAFCRRYLDTDGEQIHWDLIRCAHATIANIAIIPMQDLLGLDNRARMNRPGTLDGNWGWRWVESPSDEAAFARLRDITETFGRRPTP